MREGDALIPDNLSAHKVAGATRPLADKGVGAACPPVRSRGFNPIGHAWSKVKAGLRGAEARTAGELLPAIAAAPGAITPDDCRGWIRHCGHGLP
jgi:hypothetical protein